MIEARLTPDQSLPWPIIWPGVVLLAGRERCSLSPYRDLAGIPTQGWGATEGVLMSNADWTERECDQRLLSDLRAFTRTLAAMLTAPTSPNQLAGMDVCAYNIGLTGFRGSTILHQHNLGNSAAAAQAFLLWDKVHDPVTHQLVDSPGLLARRKDEAALYLKVSP